MRQPVLCATHVLARLRTAGPGLPGVGVQQYRLEVCGEPPRPATALLRRRAIWSGCFGHFALALAHAQAAMAARPCGAPDGRRQFRAPVSWPENLDTVGHGGGW